METAFDSLEQDLQELETERAASKGGKSGKKGAKPTGDINEDEITRLNDRLAEQDALIADKQDKITELSQTVKAFKQELAEAKNIERKQSDTIATLQKEIASKSNEGQQSRTQVNDIKRKLLEASEDSRRLHDENTRLQDTVENLEKACQLLSDQNDKMTLHISDLTDKHDNLQEHKDVHETRQEELEVQLKEMTERLEKTQEELLAAQDDGEWLAQIEILKKSLKQSQDKAAGDAKTAKTEIAALQEKVKSLSNDTLIGKKVKELEAQQAALKENLQLIDEMAKQLAAAEKNRSEAVDSLRRVEESIEQRVAERVLAEREKNRNLERTLAGLMTRTTDEADKYKSLEKENVDLHRQVDDLSNWKNIYENGHGMQGLARDQKKLKDDNRRMQVAMEQLTAKLGAVLDANGMLVHSFDKLKIECGKPPSFAYPEYQLSDDMKTENARLQSQMNEVEDQLGAIEQENTRLRKALKAQAGSVGEQGFKFAGLNADQLVKVNEFAGNLRDGKVELPVDDRSAKLLKENKRLREEREELQMKIQGFERQLLGGAGLSSATRAAVGGVAALDREQEAELMGLRDDMRKMLTENADLKDRMAAMQNEVLVLLKASVGKSDNRTEELEALLLSQNEKLTRQLNELKAQQMSGMQITSQQIEQHQQQVAAAAAAKAEADKRAGKHSQKPTPAVQSKQPQPLKVPPRQSAETPAPSGHPTQTATAAAGGAVAQYAHTPVVGTEGMGGSFYAAPPTHSYAGPGTPHGKALLGKTLTQLNLPPEEWAEEVKDINGQLVECLEQLFERERELEESQTVVSGLEDNLVAIKQQLAAIYYDFAQRSEAWESREKEIKAANLALHNERDDLALKVKRMQEMIAVTRSEDPKTIEDKLMEVSRKLTVYEVNESILARKYTSQAEQLASEQQTRERLEDNFVEMESLLKKRILYLEQYKLAAGSRLGHLQGKVDSSVPQGDYLELQAELECLREEHLKALRREVDARVAALKAKDQASELRALRVNMAHMDASLSAARSSAFNLSGQLEHQKEYTSRALAAAGQKSSSELSSIISEMAKYRGETGRLEVELAAATRRAEALTEQMTLVSDEAAQAQKTLAELELREEEASAKESAMRKTCLDMELAYQGGLTREAADALRQKLEKISQSLEESNREVARNKELAEIASLQAQTMGNFRAAHDEELRELREHCMRLESRSDDDILIGKLQRQLMATRSAYKAFVNKYQHLRGNMRQRELAVRTLETRLDQREETVIKMQEAHRLQVQALKTALRSVQNVTEDDTVKVSDGKDKSPRKGRAGVKFVTIGSKLMQMSSRVNSLAELAEQAMKKAAVAESENLTMEGMLQDLQAEKELLATQARDLEALYKGGKGKQQAVASRLVSLSEEVRVNKLACLQQRRQIQVLRAEKKHLQHVIAGFECDMETLEESKVAAETKHLLGALPGGEGKSKHLGSVDSEVAVDLSLEDFPRMAPSTAESQSRGSLNKPKIVIDVDDDGAGIGGSSDAELLEKIEAMSTQLATASKESSGLRLAADRFKDQVVFLQQALQEKDGQVQYYERVARQEGLPLIGSGATLPHVHGGGEGGANSRQLKQMKDEHAKMQEAAAATITSLKSLVDEKTRLIEQYRRKVEDLGGEKRTKSRADKRADELLQRLNETEGRSGSPSKAARGRGGQLGNLDDGDLPAAHRQLIEQLESADVMLQEKDRVAGQLEQKLAQQTNMRERAEVRCGSAIKEMDSMKADMVTLAQQLQMSEERLRRMTGRPVGGADPGDKRVVELQKAVKAKDEKVRGYREIIVRLKEEFIKAEEEKAIAAVSAAAATGGKAGGPKGAGVDAAGASGGLGADDIKDLRNQIGALRDGLRQAKEDLENARKTREKLVSARGAAQEENERLEAAVGRAEAQAASASESLHRCRKDLEESRRKEGRLRDRLKELLEAEGGSDKVKDLRAATDRLKELERELEVAKAQNLALRRAAEDGAGSTFAATAGVGSPSPLRGTAAGGGTSSTGVGATGRASAGPSGSAAAAAGSGRAPPGHFPNGPGGDAAGHLLGVGEGNQDELRNQLHTKWENEKKLQKRYGGWPCIVFLSTWLWPSLAPVVSFLVDHLSVTLTH